MLPSPFSQQNHKRKANSPFPCSKAKKVLAIVVFFFNTKLQPFFLCYKGGKIKPKQKKEDDGSCRRLLHEAALQRSFRRGRRSRRPALQRSSTTESPSSIALQRSSIVGRRRRQQLPSPSSWSCVTAAH